MADQLRSETGVSHHPSTVVLPKEVDCLSTFPSEAQDRDGRFAKPAHLFADSQIERWNEPLAFEVQDSRTLSQLAEPCDIGDDKRVEAHGSQEQLYTLAVRFDSEHDRLARAIGDVDARCAAALDAVRNIEKQVASFVAEFNHVETQTRARFDGMPGFSETAQPLAAETQRVAANVTVTPEPWKRRVTLIVDRGMRLMGLVVALILVSLTIASSFRRIDQIGAASLAAPSTVASVPSPTRSTDITLPWDQASEIPEPEPLDAPKIPTPTVEPLSSKPSPVSPPPSAAFVGSLEVSSDPPGAIVLVNGREAGVTPLQLTELPAGSYVVWLERDGYERWTSGVLVPANKLTRVAVNLDSGRTTLSPQNIAPPR